jgi:hypothetical protein
MAGSQFENVLESRFVDDAEESRLGRRGHGGTRRTIEQTHFAEEVSRLDKPECLLLAVPAGFRELHGPLTDEIKQIPRVPFSKNDFACVELNDPDIWHNFVEQIGFDTGKEPVLR